MNTRMPSISSLMRYALQLLFAIFVLVGVAFASTYTDPLSGPPGHNTTQPISVGAGDQIKTGDFWPGTMGVLSTGYFSLGTSGNSKFYSTGGKVTLSAQKFCIGASCITAWPTVTTPAPSCSFDEVSMILPIGGSPYDTDVCQASAPAGYVSTGSDSCTGVGANNCDHGTPNLKCFYVRATCNAKVVTTTSSAIEASDAACAVGGGAGFFKAPSWNPSCETICPTCEAHSYCVVDPSCKNNDSQGNPP